MKSKKSLKIQKYARQSLLYFKNAQEEINRQSYEKAGEFLWGSVVEALKALVMAKKGILIRSRKRLRKVVADLSKEYKDEDIYKTFCVAESLHSNFYEAELEKEDLLIRSESIRLLVGKLFNIAGINMEKHQ